MSDVLSLSANPLLVLLTAGILVAAGLLFIVARSVRQAEKFGVSGLAKREALKNAIVIGFSCEGCMAHVHEFRFAGRVIGFADTELAGEAVEILIVKSASGFDAEAGDSYTVPVADTCLQEIESGLFFHYG